MAEKTEKKWKLNYKILGRRPGPEAGGHPTELVDVEWTHDDGPVEDTVLLPVSHPPIHESMGQIQYEEKSVDSRDVIKDQISVREGTPDSIVMQMLEEKRDRLAKNLNIEP